MDSSGEGTDWFFIGTAVEAATQTSLPAASEPVTAATQTVQAAVAPCIADAGSTVAAVAVAGVVGVSAGALFVRWWTGNSSKKVVPADVPSADTGGMMASPAVVPHGFVPQPSLPLKEWLPHFAIPLPALEPVIPGSCPRLEFVQTCTAPFPEWFTSPQTAPSAFSHRPSQPVLAGAVVGLGFAALASAGLLGRWLWKRAGIGRAVQCQKASLGAPKPKVHGVVTLAKVQEYRSSADMKEFVAASRKVVSRMPAPLLKQEAAGRQPVGNLPGKNLSSDLTEGSVDIGFEILRRAGRSKGVASCQAEIYVLGGIVRPAPPTSSHIFRMLPKQ